MLVNFPVALHDMLIAFSIGSIVISALCFSFKSVRCCCGTHRCCLCPASQMFVTRTELTVIYKVNKLLIIAIKHNNSIVVISLFIIVATCFGHS